MTWILKLIRDSYNNLVGFWFVLTTKSLGSSSKLHQYYVKHWILALIQANIINYKLCSTIIYIQYGLILNSHVHYNNKIVIMNLKYCKKYC